MTAPMSNGRPLAEALRTPVVTSEGGILTGDTKEISSRPTWGQVAVGVARTTGYCGRCEGTGWYGDPPMPCDECRRTHSAEAVNVGIARFMDLARERQALDAEWEFAEMCHRCRIYPAAHGKFCFSCLATDASLLVPTDKERPVC